MGDANRVSLEGLLAGFVAADLRQPADPVALQTALQPRAGQVRDGGLERIEAIVERQEGVPADGNDDRLFFGCEHGGARRLRPHRRVMHEGSSAPLRDRFGVQSMLGGEMFERSVRSL